MTMEPKIRARRPNSGDDSPPVELGDKQVALIATFAADLLTRSWFVGAFDTGVQPYMARLLFGIYSSHQDGRLISKKEATALMRAVDGRTSHRYLALAEEQDLIRIEKSKVDRRVDLLRPTKKMLELVGEELRSLGNEIRSVATHLNESDSSTSQATRKEGVFPEFLENSFKARKRSYSPEELAKRRAQFEAERNLDAGIAPEGKTIAGCTEAIERDPDDPWNYIYRGLLLSQAQLFDRAIADFTEAINRTDFPRAPTRWRAYEFRAEAHKKRGDIQLAVIDLRTAIGLGGSDVLADKLIALSVEHLEKEKGERKG